MSHVKRSCATFIIVLALGVLPGSARAATIFYQATDLADVVVGQDLWEYTYTVTGITFSQDQGFSILASDSLYRDLAIPVPPNSDWDATVFQPDPVLTSPGAYDALALVSAPSLAGPFVVDFVWLGGANRPGSQPFEIYALSGEGELTVIDEGRTIPFGVPEPASALLVGVGVLAAARVRRRRS